MQHSTMTCGRQAWSKGVQQYAIQASPLAAPSRQTARIATCSSSTGRSPECSMQQLQPGVSQLVRLANDVALRRRRGSFACRAVATPPAPSTMQQHTPVDAVPRGETAGAVLVLEDVTLQAGDRDLLESAEWRMMPGQRVGLVGANGAGKSTLLKTLAGLRTVDAGTVLVAPGVSVGYLAQTAVSGSKQTVYQEARGAMSQLVAAEAALTAAETAADAGDPTAAQSLADAHEAFEAAGGYDADRRIGVVLDGLGFSREQWEWGCERFSGGWQMRIALAKLLLSPAGQAAYGSSTGGDAGGGLLLLDEPTNHLDTGAVKWLAGFLASSGGSLVLVSHDEALLEGACDRIVEVRGRRLHHYVGSYKTFLVQREERATLAAATAASHAAETKRLEDFVARFGAKASKAAEAQSKLKLLEKLRREAAATAEPVAAASGSGPGDARKVALRLPRPPPCFTEVLDIQKLSVGWRTPSNAFTATTVGSGSAVDTAAAGAVPVLADVNFTISKGQRVLVLGPNGAGKSTLLKALAGRLQPWSGSIKQGEGVKLGVFDQDLAQELPPDQTALDYVSQVARRTDVTLTLHKVRSALGALGLTGSLPLQLIGSLSGGEKARVALAVFALVPANVLLLDEASNHLDSATLEVLTGALQDFGGAIVAITHNRAFATALQPTHILRVTGGTAKLSEHRGALSSKDFDHSVAGSSSGSSSSSSGGSKGSGSGSSSKAASSSNHAVGGKKGKQKSGLTPAALSQTVSTKTSGNSNPNSRSKPTRKRTTLSYSEQLRYQALCKELDSLNAKRTELEGKLAALAQSSNDVAALEQTSMELAEVAEKVDEAELEWLELAELAGDL